MRCFNSLVLLWVYVSLGSSAKILGFFTVPSISHQQIFQAICKRLALNGHEVTFVTTDVVNDTSIQNLTEIDISHLYDLMETIDFRNSLARDSHMFRKILGYFELMGVVTLHALEDRQIQRLIAGDEKFDFLLVQAVHPLMFSVASRFRVPVVGK